ncbi:hypothetical protein FYK55_25390 [Roseiconus nitratireducens]|uniref:Fibronectin type-III domain-containing protein n=1 Tax=Roseiconus nitratireducens TaxID=2605748 RepID=A0A5M6D1T1_9BACT|nr:hypothetical protein [Roseiconus nitratireducens]KAA5539075.1 hypothetical protein FYK55_25390 [Roseiconus nitratireducens]
MRLIAVTFIVMTAQAFGGLAFSSAAQKISIAQLSLFAQETSPLPQDSQDSAPISSSADPAAESSQSLQFDQTRFEAAEGYLTLTWNELNSAAEYSVRQDSGLEVYRGPLPEAFVSGLPDGTYQFTVDALDTQGQVIARSAQPAVVEVVHWPLRMALALFFGGLVIFLLLIAVIIRGALGQPEEAAAEPSTTQPETTT